MKVSLLELCKRHNEWLKMATRITNCNIKAKDLVQDMYLKVGKSDINFRKEYSNLIYTIMRNIYRDQEKKLYINQKDSNTKIVFIELDSLRDL